MEAIIVPCTKEKIWDDQPGAPRQVPAKDAYTKSVFKKWKKKWKNYAEQSGAPWFILSTKYGLIEPDKLIENYDRTPSDALCDIAFKDLLREQGNELLGKFKKVILLGWCENFMPLVKIAGGERPQDEYECKGINY